MHLVKLDNPETPTRRRGITNQRQVRRRTDGLAVVTWRGRDFAAPALELLAVGTSVYVVPAGAHSLAVFRERQPRDRRPLCVATPASRQAATDEAQTTLPLAA